MIQRYIRIADIRNDIINEDKGNQPYIAKKGDYRKYIIRINR